MRVPARGQYKNDSRWADDVQENGRDFLIAFSLVKSTLKRREEQWQKFSVARRYGGMCVRESRITLVTTPILQISVA
jgi:hypothetical protein